MIWAIWIALGGVLGLCLWMLFEVWKEIKSPLEQDWEDERDENPH